MTRPARPHSRQPSGGPAKNGAPRIASAVLSRPELGQPKRPPTPHHRLSASRCRRTATTRSPAWCRPRARPGPRRHPPAPDPPSGAGFEPGSDVVTAGLPEPAEGGRVPPRLRREMAAEAEHVGPPAPPLVRALGTGQTGEASPQRHLPDELLQPPQMRVAGRAVAAMSAAALVAYFATYAATVSGCSSVPVVFSAVRLPVHRSGVDLAAEPQQPDHIRPVDRRRLVATPARRPRRPGRPGRRRPARRPAAGTHRPGAGGPSSRIRAWKWIDAASLELGDLRELHPHQLPARGLRQAEVAGQTAAQGDGEPAPQLRRPPLPHQMPEVVVAVRAQRLTRPRCRRAHGWSCTTVGRPCGQSLPCRCRCGDGSAGCRVGRASSPHAPARTRVRSRWRTPADA